MSTQHKNLGTDNFLPSGYIYDPCELVCCTF